jgi:ferric-dicitrate binding protein FerR (iron transport regulator)
VSRRADHRAAREVDAAAARWAIWIEEHGDEPDTKVKFEFWLSGGRRRAGALLRAQAMLGLIAGALVADCAGEGGRKRRGECKIATAARAVSQHRGDNGATCISGATKR